MSTMVTRESVADADCVRCKEVEGLQAQGLERLRIENTEAQRQGEKNGGLQTRPAQELAQAFADCMPGTAALSLLGPDNGLRTAVRHAFGHGVTVTAMVTVSTPPWPSVI